MSKASDRILRSAREALAFSKGKRAGHVVHAPETVDVRAVRRRLRLSQRQFAARFGFALSALQNWEQGRRQPDASARLFIKVIAREPEAVARALAT